MKKVNWWIDPLMLPIMFIGFMLGYIWHSFCAGFVAAEFIFDSESFNKRYL